MVILQGDTSLQQGPTSSQTMTLHSLFFGNPEGLGLVLYGDGSTQTQIFKLNYDSHKMFDHSIEFIATGKTQR